jgi:hypothetical protein
MRQSKSAGLFIGIYQLSITVNKNQGTKMKHSILYSLAVAASIFLCVNQAKADPTMNPSWGQIGAAPDSNITSGTPASVVAPTLDYSSGNMHKGFQFRGALGVGYLSNNEPSSNTTFYGPAGTVEVYFGGSLQPRLFIGGMLSETSAIGPSISHNNVVYNTPNDLHMNLGTLGPYIDWYPSYNGFHVLGTFGFADLSLSVAGVSYSASGPYMGTGVGYDWWVSRNWNVGVLSKFTYAPMTYTNPEGNQYDENGTTFTVMFSVAYH